MIPRLLVTGTRRALTGDEKLHIRTVVLAAIRARSPNREAVTVVHGGCPTGVDSYVDTLIGQLPGHVTTDVFTADWDTHGRRAGPIRNGQMVARGAYVCLGFPSPHSRGTWDCVKQAATAGIVCHIYPLVDALEDQL